MEYNHKYEFTGHVFEKRYTAILVENPEYFLEVSRYIHLNPVKAGMVLDPLDYEYSSYGVYIGQIQMSMVNTDDILNLWAVNQQEQYRLFVEEKMSTGNALGNYVDEDCVDENLISSTKGSD